MHRTYQKITLGDQLATRYPGQTLAIGNLGISYGTEFPRQTLRVGGCVGCVSALTPTQVLSPVTALRRAGVGQLEVTEDTAKLGWLIAGATAMALGAFVGAYHGNERSGGKTGATVGWGLAGAIFPLPTLAVAAVQGYGKRRGR